MKSSDWVLRHRAYLVSRKKLPIVLRVIGPLDKSLPADYWKPATQPYALSACFEKSSNVKSNVADC
jgi:hypothetical protein